MNTCCYLSTRGRAPVLDFEQVLLCGTAQGGGLYVPECWPRLSDERIRSLRGCSYLDCATAVLEIFGLENSSPLVAESYGSFDHAAIAPLVQCDEQIWLMELFHGPTLSFKDIALQVLGRLLERVGRRQRQTKVLVGATSGDTGSAAIEAIRGREWLELVMLHPKGRTSEIQRRQMTCVTEPNIHNLAIEGSFDDCQNLVKGLFANENLQTKLSAVNSINWARIAAQIVYYLWAAVALGALDRRISFAVPTGNFGNIYAAYAARSMGIPIECLIIGNNRNDALTRFLHNGRMESGEVIQTLSPSMDIQIPSNLERFLFDLYERDGEALVAAMASGFILTQRQHDQLKATFWGWMVDDQHTCLTIEQTYRQTGLMIDPHTAVGIAAARAAIAQGVVGPDTAIVALGCAHPAKFPDVVEQATGQTPQLPARLTDLYQRSEHYHTLANDQKALSEFIQLLPSLH